MGHHPVREAVGRCGIPRNRNRSGPAIYLPVIFARRDDTMLPCAAVCRGLEENMGPIAEFAVVIFEYTQATEKEGLCKLFAIVVVVFVRLCFSPRASLCTIPNGNIDR